MINSVKVYLDISRQFTWVQIKNLFTFCYKNHLGRKVINAR
jgi:hypothetical protein